MTGYPAISEQLSTLGEARREGRRAIEWARQHMPILSEIRDEFESDRPLENQRIGMAMHVEAKTAVLVETLAAGGATVAVTGCNPLSTHDEVSAALDEQEFITSFAKRGIGEDEYYEAIRAVIDFEPTITVDDGGDLVFAIHEEYPELIDTVIGGCEETTTGVHRLRAMEEDGALRYPMYAVNDSPMKRLFDNVHGTGESSLSNIAITTNLSWAGKTVVIAGFGYCGKGLAKKASGQNARVVVTEVEPRRALEAHMEGYEVMPMEDASEEGQIFITTTGNRDVIREEHLENMDDGAVLANAGHFNVEIDLEALDDRAEKRYESRPGIETYRFPDGTRISVLAEGRLVNLASPNALGHPIEVMDQSFGVQAACIRDLAERADSDPLDPGVHDVPDDLDRKVAETKLAAEGILIDELTESQKAYMMSWEHGT